MHSRILLLLSMLLMATPAFASIPSTLDDMLNLLDDAVNDNEAYISQRFNRIDSLKRQLIKNPNDLSLYATIGNDLKGIAIDSALCYYDLGIAMASMQNDAPSRQYFEIQRSATLPIMGITKEELTIQNIPSFIIEELHFPLLEKMNTLYGGMFSSDSHIDRLVIPKNIRQVQCAAINCQNLKII